MADENSPGAAGSDPLDTMDIETFKTAISDINSLHDRMDDAFSRPGAQLADKLTFKNKSGETVTACPILVDLRRLVQLVPSNTSAIAAADVGIIPGISNRELLHAVVGLYDVTLTEMTPDVLYSTVCEKWARTIILVRDLKETTKDLETRSKKEKDNQEKIKDNQTKDQSNLLTNEQTKGSGQNCNDEEEDKYTEEEAQPSKFTEVFSDTESEEEEDEEDDEEDFSKGINTFIKKSTQRRKSRTAQQGAIKDDNIGIENRIIGCITFEKKYVRHKERVVHLTLLTVRKRFRKYGIGRYLLQQVIDPSVVGHYDAVVVHADNAAVDFFQRFGFSDDIVLNSRWSELAEQFTNCTLMCFLPGFSGHSLLSSIKLPGFEVFELEQEFNKWKEKTIEVYQSQVSIVMRMKHEILQLKSLTDKQTSLIETLLGENDRLKKERYILGSEISVFQRFPFIEGNGKIIYHAFPPIGDPLR